MALPVLTANITNMTVDLLTPIRCTSFKTKQLARLVGRIYDAEMAAVSLKASQFSLLTHVANHGPIGVGALAKRMALEGSTMTRNLRPLLANQWIALTSGTDARHRLISITPSGRSKQEAALVCWAKAQQKVNAIVGVETVRELQTLIDDCLVKLKA
jgi:DNA-binding MarR family transcriptional regulator